MTFPDGWLPSAATTVSIKSIVFISSSKSSAVFLIVIEHVINDPIFVGVLHTFEAPIPCSPAAPVAPPTPNANTKPATRPKPSNTRNPSRITPSSSSRPPKPPTAGRKPHRQPNPHARQTRHENQPA